MVGRFGSQFACAAVECFHSFNCNPWDSAPLSRRLRLSQLSPCPGAGPAGRSARAAPSGCARRRTSRRRTRASSTRRSGAGRWGCQPILGVTSSVIHNMWYVCGNPDVSISGLFGMVVKSNLFTGLQQKLSWASGTQSNQYRNLYQCVFF